MTALQPATLQRLTRVGRPTKDEPARVTPDGDALPVQFNPASLRLSRRNNVDRAGVTTGSQKVQHPSTEPSTLTFELEFDTAEQGTVASRVNVRDWTALVRQFVEPPDGKQGEAAPAVQFQWGKLIYRGIVTDLTEELDFFAPDGTPLHAKMAVTISEQRFELEKTAGPAQRDASRALAPGGAAAGGGLGAGFGASLSAGVSASFGAGASIGMSGTADAQLLVAALDGESAQQLLTRLGKDPAAWRAAMSGLDSPLTLTAGGSVQLGAEVDGGVGGGVQAGFAAEGSVDTEAALAAAVGVGVDSRASAGFRADARADGFALAAAGGVAAASARVETAVVHAVTTEARASFDVPPGGGPPPVLDARATTYGRGVPLQGAVSLQASAAGSAGWSADATADAEQRSRDAGSSTLRWSPGR